MLLLAMLSSSLFDKYYSDIVLAGEHDENPCLPSRCDKLQRNVSALSSPRQTGDLELLCGHCALGRLTISVIRNRRFVCAGSIL